jgi:hypothetical protein
MFLTPLVLHDNFAGRNIILFNKRFPIAPKWYFVATDSLNDGSLRMRLKLLDSKNGDVVLVCDVDNPPLRKGKDMRTRRLRSALQVVSVAPAQMGRVLAYQNQKPIENRC